MAKITQYSRISHHTTSGYTGSVFTVPTSTDFTDGSWTIYDLALSEIGVNETDKRAFLRCNDEVKELTMTSFFTASTSGTGSFTFSQYSVPTGEVKGFKITTKGISDDSNKYSYVTEIFAGIRNDGTALKITGTTYSQTTMTDFSSTSMGPVLSVSGFTASLLVNGAAGYTVSWTTDVHIF